MIAGSDGLQIVEYRTFDDAKIVIDKFFTAIKSKAPTKHMARV